MTRKRKIFYRVPIKCNPFLTQCGWGSAGLRSYLLFSSGGKKGKRNGNLHLSAWFSSSCVWSVFLFLTGSDQVASNKKTVSVCVAIQQLPWSSPLPLGWSLVLKAIKNDVLFGEEMGVVGCRARWTPLEKKSHLLSFSTSFTYSQLITLTVGLLSGIHFVSPSSSSLATSNDTLLPRRGPFSIPQRF